MHFLYTVFFNVFIVATALIFVGLKYGQRQLLPYAVPCVIGSAVILLILKIIKRLNG